MAISQKHRSSIYQQLAPLIGEEEAEVLLSQFPSRDLDELVTKEFVRAETALVRSETALVRSDLQADIAELRTEMHTEIGNLRTEMYTEFGKVRTEMSTEFGKVYTGIADLRAEMHSRFRAMTMWIVSAMAIGMGLAAGIGRL